MEADLLDKFKRSLSSSTSILCRICGLSISKKGGPKSDQVYQKFCKEIKYLRDSKRGVNCLLCPECLKAVSLVMNDKERAEEMEGRVRTLQRQLLILLGKLQQRLSNYHKGMQKLEEIIEENNLSKPEKMSLAEQLERKEVVLFRYRISDAICDLKIFQSELDVKGAVENEDFGFDPLGFDDNFPTEEVEFKVEPDFQPELDDSFIEAEDQEEDEEEEKKKSHPGPSVRSKLPRLTKSFSGVGDGGNADADMDDDDYIPSEEEQDESSDDEREKNNEESPDNDNVDLPPPPPDPSLDLLKTYPELNKLTDFKRLVFCRILYHFQEEATKKGGTLNISSNPIDPSNFSCFFDLPATPTEPQKAPFRYDQKKRRIFLGEIEILVDEEKNSVQCSKCDYNFNYCSHRILPYLVQDHIIEVHFPPTTKNQTEVNIRRRMRGEPYYGFRVCEETGQRRFFRNGAPRGGKEMGPPCTSVYCAKSKKYCYIFNEEDRFELFFKFWKTMNWKEKQEFVKSHSETVPIADKRAKGVRSGRHILFLTLNGARLKVCKNFFQSTLGIQRSKILGWINPGKYRKAPEEKKPSGPRAPRAPRPKKPPMSFPCSTCGKTYPARYRLVQHERNHVRTKCHGCGMDVLEKALKKHQSQSCKVLATDPPYLVCPQCGKQQKGLGGLRDHLNRLHGIRGSGSTKVKADATPADSNPTTSATEIG